MSYFDGKTLELAEDYYVDPDGRKVDDDELFRREADIVLKVEQFPTYDTQPPVLVLRVA